jgi:predicted nicotinamide N-methyase
MLRDSHTMLETTYAGPVRTSLLNIAGRPIRLVRPADPDRLLDDPTVRDWNRVDDYMPYWAYLWPGAFLLAEVMAREPVREGTQALEIGCGLGLAGIVALGRGLAVRFTDYDPAPLEFVGRSVAANGLNPALASTARLDWRELPDERYALILGADVLYERRLVPLVANVLHRMLAPGGLALIADPYRSAAEGFRSDVERLGLIGNAEPVSAETAELGPIRGTLHRVYREES